mmetsp:Transcript_45276/g.94361  ORF Transcript_45276/g.94361 Transcript_45276/m.94361 type:complete len:273 (+) Transcript_45276:224-1042(+)
MSVCDGLQISPQAPPRPACVVTHSTHLLGRPAAPDQRRCAEDGGGGGADRHDAADRSVEPDGGGGDGGDGGAERATEREEAVPRGADACLGRLVVRGDARLHVGQRRHDGQRGEETDQRQRGQREAQRHRRRSAARRRAEQVEAASEAHPAKRHQALETPAAAARRRLATVGEEADWKRAERVCTSIRGEQAANLGLVPEERRREEARLEDRVEALAHGRGQHDGDGGDDEVEAAPVARGSDRRCCRLLLWGCAREQDQHRQRRDRARGGQG